MQEVKQEKNPRRSAISLKVSTKMSATGVLALFGLIVALMVATSQQEYQIPTPWGVLIINLQRTAHCQPIERSSLGSSRSRPEVSGCEEITR